MGKNQKQDAAEREIKKLKEIARSQRKEIFRLIKRLKRREDVSQEYKELLEETDTASEDLRKPSTASCPKCGHDVDEVPIGKFTLQTCKSCPWHGRKK